MTSVALIVNPASGAADRLDAANALAELGVDVLELDLDRAGEAAEAEVERIVVVGGDGTLGCAAEVATRAGIPLGVVPAGTANDFAARMGLSDDPGEALRLAVSSGGTRPVDLARVGSRPFVNVASLGLPPAAATEAAEMKESLGALAYTVGALRAGLEREPLRCRVRADGAVIHEGRTWQVTVGCSGAFGGGAQIDADADDGRLDLVLIEDGSRLRLAKHAIGLRTGSVEDQDGVRSVRARTIEVEAPADEELNVDGEVVPAIELREGEEPLRFEVAGSFRLVIG